MSPTPFIFAAQINTRKPVLAGSSFVLFSCVSNECLARTYVGNASNGMPAGMPQQTPVTFDLMGVWHNDTMNVRIQKVQWFWPNGYVFDPAFGAVILLLTAQTVTMPPPAPPGTMVYNGHQKAVTNFDTGSGLYYVEFRKNTLALTVVYTSVFTP
jgi:hypothetical protein